VQSFRQFTQVQTSKPNHKECALFLCEPFKELVCPLTARVWYLFSLAPVIEGMSDTACRSLEDSHFRYVYPKYWVCLSETSKAHFCPHLSLLGANGKASGYVLFRFIIHPHTCRHNMHYETSIQRRHGLRFNYTENKLPQFQESGNS